MPFFTVHHIQPRQHRHIQAPGSDKCWHCLPYELKLRLAPSIQRKPGSLVSQPKRSLPWALDWLKLKWRHVRHALVCFSICGWRVKTRISASVFRSVSEISRLHLHFYFKWISPVVHITATDDSTWLLTKLLRLQHSPLQNKSTPCKVKASMRSF